MSAEKRIRVDPTRPLAAQPGVGHNRWHPDLTPVLEVACDEPFTLETIDACDAFITAASTAADLVPFPDGRIHPLTGPVAVSGVEPGDVLQIEVLDVAHGPVGTSAFGPGEGLLPALLSEHALFFWELDCGGARSPQLPGVTIPPQMFPGTLGVAPSWEEIRAAREREMGGLDADALRKAEAASDAVPAICHDGLRTVPPRSNGGNVDVRELTAGSRLLVAAQVRGGLVSVGDLHFAQGDGELAATAIEMAGAVTLRCSVLDAPGWRRALPAVIAPPRPPRPAVQTIGVGLGAYGRSAADGLADAAVQAAEAMIAWLQDVRGLTPAQAYLLLSVAADLKVSQLVNDPNPVVSARLPLDVFDEPIDDQPAAPM